MLEMSQSCLLSRTVGWWPCGALVNKTSHFDWWEPKICFTASQMETIHSAVCCVLFSHSKGRKTAYFLVKGNEKRLFIYMHKHTHTQIKANTVMARERRTRRGFPQIFAAFRSFGQNRFCFLILSFTFHLITSPMSISLSCTPLIDAAYSHPAFLNSKIRWAIYVLIFWLFGFMFCLIAFRLSVRLENNLRSLTFADQHFTRLIK